MSWRACMGWIANLPVRTTLLVALLVLGGWGMLTAVSQVSMAYEGYRQSQEVIVWARTSNNLFRMAQHFAFERGRTAVVLRAPQVISAENRELLDQRRTLANMAMQEFLSNRHLLPEVGQEALAKQWEAIQVQRLEVDQNAKLPLAERNPQLAEQWFDSATQFLTDSRKTTQQLVSSYVRNRGMNLARPTLIAAYAFELRLTLGAESSMIAQSLASGKPMNGYELSQMYELRGKEKNIWEEISRLRRYAPLPNLDPAIDSVWKEHYETLRPQQDAILSDWASGRTPSASLQMLTGSGLPALDGISKLMQLAAGEVELLAIQHQQLALQALLRSLVASTVILAIMLLAIWYVLRKVVQPLEVLGGKLRDLIADRAIPYPPHTRNEIACLQEATELVSHLWQEKSRLEGELHNFAFQDSLTQLPNRRLLMERIQQARIKNERRNQFACLLFIDLDKFKQVNDKYGHELGDHLLVAVAERLKNLLREEDTIARLGGDEFIVLLDSLGCDKAEADSAATLIRNKLDLELTQPYVLGEYTLRCSASIGYKLFHGSDEDMCALIRAADADMYQCKSKREGGYAEVSPRGLQDEA